jgi:hypothetical protein
MNMEMLSHTVTFPELTADDYNCFKCSKWRVKRFGVDRYEGAEYPKHIIILKQVIRYYKEFIHA